MGEATERLKVVARLRDGSLIKGYMEALQVHDPDTFIKKDTGGLPPEIQVQSADSGETHSVPVESLKALFFVKSFEGSKDYREVKFFEKNPPIEGLWIQVKFYDDESLEGVVRNSIDFLIEPGFFLKPPDPQSNNDILYVVKSSMMEFHVLGVREAY